MRQTRALHQRGISVLELILAVTLILAVAAIVVPGPAPEAMDKEEKIAYGQCEKLSQALAWYERDTGYAPIGRAGAPTFSWLRGPGVDPSFSSHPGGLASELDWFLLQNKMGGGERWGGPYVNFLGPDPWGRRYIVVLKHTTKHVVAHTWVLSAGPDGVIETTPGDSIPVGDDVGVWMN